MLQTLVKSYTQLNLQELYAVLQLRAEVFVVEQNCVYQDLDGKDSLAHHVLGQATDKLVAYSRIFAPGTYFKEASIGRVVVSPSARGLGYGKDIMNASIKAVANQFGTQNIRLSAQCYLHQFYSDLGFVPKGKEYLEDGIPHIAMYLNGDLNGQY